MWYHVWLGWTVEAFFLYPQLSIFVRHSPCARSNINPLNAELNPICHLLALLGVHLFLHVSRIMVKSLTL